MSATLMIKPSYGEEFTPRNLNMCVLKKFVEEELALEVIYMKREKNGDIFVKVDGVPDIGFLNRVNEINGVPVQVGLPVRLNFITGRIFHPELAYLSPTEIQELIQDEIVFDIKKTTDSNWADISWLISNRTVLPDVVRLGWDWVKVRPTIKRPVRCYRCQAYGHRAAVCEKPPVCAICAEEHEPIQECTKTPKCPACGGSHTAFDPACPTWKEENEIAKIKQKEKISYSEAVKKRRQQKKEEEKPAEEEEQEDSEEEDINIDEEQEESKQEEATTTRKRQKKEEENPEEDQQMQAQSSMKTPQPVKTGPQTDHSGGWQKVASRKKSKAVSKT